VCCLFSIILSAMKPLINIADLGNVWQQSYSRNNTGKVEKVFDGFVFYIDADKDNRIYFHLKNRAGKNVSFRSLFVDYKPLLSGSNSPSYVLYSCIEAACRKNVSLVSWTAETGDVLYLDENDALSDALFVRRGY
jgi:hypothetical protein